MPNIITTALATLLVVASTGVATAQEAFGPRSALEALSGTYASPAPEPWYGGFGTRSFTFDGDRWTLTFTHALNDTMQNPTFRFRTEGPFAIGSPSTVVPGAFEAIFYEDVKWVTLLTADAGIVSAFGLAGCGLTLNVETDISQSGCAGWKPVVPDRKSNV